MCAKFNTTNVRQATGQGPIVSDQTPTTLTNEGAPGYLRDTKSELFLLAVTNMVTERTFYENATDRDTRYTQLIRQAATSDPAWTTTLLRWLRQDGNMRSASISGALEAAKALLDTGIPGGRQLVDTVLRRADEPGEAIAYWISRHGRRIPKPIKRGIADAATRLYTPYNLLKYDTARHGVRFADVIDLTHPSPANPEQGRLFQAALERRHGRDDIIPIPMLTANAALRAEAATDPAALLDTDRLYEAGMTWEDALSLAGSRVDKARLWTALIPTMGYMALLRNLRNLDQAGVPDDVALGVAARLADPDEVVRSRQLPMRFLSAFKSVPSLRWSHALELAIGHSLANVPPLPGRTLILVDVSGSMSCGVSGRSELRRSEVAGVFASALALRARESTLVWFNHSSGRIDVPAGGALLRLAQSIPPAGGGTMTAGAIRRWYDGHDRCVVITDEQCGHPDPSAAIPRDRPMYTWNLAGYRVGSTSTGPNRLTFGGLTDASFRLIPLVESGRSGSWPWETASQ